MTLKSAFALIFPYLTSVAFRPEPAKVEPMPHRAIARLREIVDTMKVPRVLLVEDDDNDIWCVRDALHGLQVILTVAETRKEALNLIQTDRFDLCFLDLKLPDSDDPVDLVESIQQASPPTHIVVLTGSLSNPNLRQVLEKKVLAVMLKPLTREQMKGVFHQ